MGPLPGRPGARCAAFVDRCPHRRCPLSLGECADGRAALRLPRLAVRRRGPLRRDPCSRARGARLPPTARLRRPPPWRRLTAWCSWHPRTRRPARRHPRGRRPGLHGWRAPDAAGAGLGRSAGRQLLGRGALPFRARRYLRGRGGGPGRALRGRPRRLVLHRRLRAPVRPSRGPRRGGGPSPAGPDPASDLPAERALPPPPAHRLRRLRRLQRDRVLHPARDRRDLPALHHPVARRPRRQRGRAWPTRWRSSWRSCEEDLRIQEAYHELVLPLEPTAEVHTRADRATLELRRVLADLVAAAGAGTRTWSGRDDASPWSTTPSWPTGWPSCATGAPTATPSASWSRRSRGSWPTRRCVTSAPTEVSVDTPVALGAPARRVAEVVLLVPILRAGLGMVQAIQDVVPLTEVAHVGLRRDEATLRSEVYLNRLPRDLAGRRVIVCDPMLATGGSLVQVCDLVAERGAAEVVALCIIASEPGLAAFRGRPPGVRRVLRRRRPGARRRRLHRARTGRRRGPPLRAARLTSAPPHGRSVAAPTGRCPRTRLGVGRDEAAQQLDALGVVEHDDPAAVLGHPGVAALEVACLADDHGADPELAQQPAAVPARRERGDHDAVGVVAPASGGPEGGRLGVHGGVAVLDPAVVPAAEQGAVLVEEGGADGDAPFGQTRAGLLQRDGEHLAGQGLVERAQPADICSAVRVMSTSADRTYTTTVGSQDGRAPARRPRPTS